MKTKVSLIKCDSYETQKVIDAVNKAVDLIGGIDTFIKPGEKILLKPNLLGARTPDRAITTHPEIVRAMVRLVKKAGATPIVGDSPGGAVKGVERVWAETGMKRLSEEEGCQLVNFETSGSVEKNINHPLLPSIHIAKIVTEVDGIINLPKLKTHGLMLYTGAIKNLYGCVPGMRKAEYHKIVPHPDDFSHLLDEIYLLVKSKIRFSLVDGIMGMEGNGPSSGEKRKLDMILASQDSVLLDLAITKLLGLSAKRIESINYLYKKQIESRHNDQYEIIGNKPGEFNVSNFKFPANWHVRLVPKWLVKFLGKYVWLKPQVVQSTCINCKLCANSCPVAAIENGGKDKPRVVFDRCISCLCCHELCPVDSIELKKSFIVSLLARD
jgi:uncharacterized protein (DUF362 family)/Pyruvate/2-oxoacid:ferredoxin oxidoreductase delta subunit